MKVLSEVSPLFNCSFDAYIQVNVCKWACPSYR